MPLRTVTSPAAFLKVLMMPCMSIMASGADIASCASSAVALREVSSVFMDHLPTDMILTLGQQLQLPVRDLQSACEARRQCLIVRDHHDGLSLICDQMF